MRKAESFKTDFNVNMMGDLGIGLFNNQEEFENVHNDNSSQEKDQMIESSSNDSAPILRLQPSPIAELDYEAECS